MREELLSVGIDLGTSTTQLVFSRLFIENMAGSYSVPRMEITGKEIQYKSHIYFTPLMDQNTIDFPKIRQIVEREYERAGVKKEEIDTGAVIITGETARKENAREVVNALSGFAGDFVVATAGPDLESVIAGKGAGTDVYSRENRRMAVNIDIGGGTSNLAAFWQGDTVDTGCLDVGGRLIRVDRDTGKVTYIAPKLLRIIEGEGFSIRLGGPFSVEGVRPLLRILVRALEQSVGLRRDCKYYELLITNHGLSPQVLGSRADKPAPSCATGAGGGEERWEPPASGTPSHTKAEWGNGEERWEPVSCVSFSGGVAAVLYHPEDYPDPLQFGDMGILLAREIRSSRLFRELRVIESAETIRATVVGAGSHTTEISGSTITYANAEFPLKNLPVLKLAREEEQPGRLAGALERKLRWFWTEGQPVRLAVALEGEANPTFVRVQEYAKELLTGLAPNLRAGLPTLVVVAQDMAKALGQTLLSMAGSGGALVCLDGIRLSEGDYIDIGRPAAGGSVLPVVVKTLVFQK